MKVIYIIGVVYISTTFIMATDRKNKISEFIKKSTIVKDPTLKNQFYLFLNKITLSYTQFYQSVYTIKNVNDDPVYLINRLYHDVILKQRYNPQLFEAAYHSFLQVLNPQSQLLRDLHYNWIIYKKAEEQKKEIRMIYQLLQTKK